MTTKLQTQLKRWRSMGTEERLLHLIAYNRGLYVRFRGVNHSVSMLYLDRAEGYQRQLEKLHGVI